MDISAAGGPGDAQSGHGTVPAFEVRVQLLQAVKAPSFEGIVFDVATPSLGDALLLGMPGPGGQGHKPSVAGLRTIFLIAIVSALFADSVSSIVDKAHRVLAHDEPHIVAAKPGDEVGIGPHLSSAQEVFM